MSDLTERTLEAEVPEGHYPGRTWFPRLWTEGDVRTCCTGVLWVCKSGSLKRAPVTVKVTMQHLTLQLWSLPPQQTGQLRRLFDQSLLPCKLSKTWSHSGHRMAA